MFPIRMQPSTVSAVAVIMLNSKAVLYDPPEHLIWRSLTVVLSTLMSSVGELAEVPSMNAPFAVAQ